MKKFILFSSILTMTILLSFSVDSAFAHPHHGNILINNHTHEPLTEITPINSMIGLEKSTVFFHAPSGNTLPWGFVEGKVANHVEGYPVIIQIFKNNDAVHFAQTDIGEDGVYEYKFRILNSDKNHTTKIFEGDYSVKIFKVVYLNQENMI
ncbi:hypothetical protein [Nitrosopumilus adriaticus]|uniref:Uncharacterized protein n=1 Tax=Nitrosopumilus adriaticus TaxID=1580092 RepID=A0A0D5C4S1_9ARCH|nr:hypothetical protein [Nitrosopumilus adriaticus]AJW71731.1 conserved exported protein of unknown function [Nitrosopumilus adriaticus]